MRYYYKSKKGNAYFNLKSPKYDGDENYIAITEEEWNAHNAVSEPTAEQKARAEKLRQIASLKAQLAQSDYKAIKYAEGWISEEDYAPIKAERQTLRDQINELEQEL